MRGIAHVEDREIDVLLHRALHRRGAVGHLGDDAEVGLGVEQITQPVQHDRVVVGQQDAGDQRKLMRPPQRAPEGDLRAMGPSRPDRELGPDEQRALAHPAQTV